MSIGTETITDSRDAGLTPQPPQTLEDLGVPADRLAELLLKTLVSGEANGSELADRLAVPFSILEPIVEYVRLEKLVEVRGAAGVGSAGYRYTLTDMGRDRARQFLDVSRYIGPVPVPLSQYVRYIKTQAKQRGVMNRERIAVGFSHLVVNEHMLEQLGPAVNSGKSLFLYGPPGNGKTVIAEGIGQAMGGAIYVPHAIDVDGQTITMFDMVNHERRGVGTDRESQQIPLMAPSHEHPPGVRRWDDVDKPSSVIAAHGHDRRWVRIRRPVVTVGGELTLEMLDLTFNPISRFYEAPIQLKANGGVFVVDDFGRQRIPARDLLNRWIVPLESRVDYLTLHTGRKFEIPFDVFIVFATNLKPESLADEAFLRRIPYKVYASNPSVEEYTRIFEMYCGRRGLGFDPVIIDYLMQRYYEPRDIQMRACHPRDLVEHMVDICNYHERPPVITRELVDAACESYFLEEQEAQSGREDWARDGVLR